MKILFLDAYFEPEKTAYSRLEADLIECLTSAGHTVKVVCPIPTRGISDDTYNAYKSKRYENIGERIRVRRFYAPRERSNPILRALRYFWCNFMTFVIGEKQKDADIVFSNSTPPTQGYIAAKVAKKLKKPFLFNLQDIFPDSLVNANMTTNGSLLYKVGRKIEDYTYKNADKIIVIGDSFKENIMEKGVPEEKIEVIPNWVDTDNIKPVSRDENALFDEYNISRDKFIVTYAGNFGASQGTDVILSAAEMLRDNADIGFVLFGGGSEFPKAIDTVANKNLTNVSINPLLPPERLSEVYSMGDISLVTCKKGVGKAAIPSKTWSIMACGTPIMAAFDKRSELADILVSNGLGICTEPENARSLAEAILRVKNKNIFSFENGRKYVLEHADKRVCTEKYIDIVDNLRS